MTGFLRREWRCVLFASVLVAAVLLAATGAVTAQSAPDCSLSYNGDGTEANPYEVENVDQLQCIEAQGLDANYVQVSDIDASETESWNGGKGFEPIGDTPFTGTPFTGEFDGKGYMITNLIINRNTVSTGSVGLFGGVNSAGAITDASVVNINVDGIEPVGGLVAWNKGVVSNSYASGLINGSDSVGGLVGDNTIGTVTNSYSTAEVTGSGIFIGGLVGDNDMIGGTEGGGTISKSYATGSVEGSGDVGGLVGFNGGMVEKSYATGSVNGTRPRTTSSGGIVGFNVGMVEKSYAVGSVYGSEEVGGLVGSNGGSIKEGGEITESYWDILTTGQPISDGGTGLTTSEIIGSAAPNNMQGFDFTNTWETITNPDDYPILAWQQPTASFTPSTNSLNVGEAITFDASASSDSDGSVVSYAWDFDGDGTTDVTRTAPLVTHTYDAFGEYAVTLTVTDDNGATDSTVKTVEVRDPSTSPVDGVSDALWVAVAQNDGTDGLSLADLGNAIQEYRANPSDADVGGVSIGLSDLGSLIQYYRTEVV